MRKPEKDIGNYLGFYITVTVQKLERDSYKVWNKSNRVWTFWPVDIGDYRRVLLRTNYADLYMVLRPRR